MKKQQDQPKLSKTTNQEQQKTQVQAQEKSKIKSSLTPNSAQKNNNPNQKNASLKKQSISNNITNNNKTKKKVTSEINKQTGKITKKTKTKTQISTKKQNSQNKEQEENKQTEDIPDIQPDKIGRVQLQYNYSKEDFVIINGNLKMEDIEEYYGFSDVFQGNFQLILEYKDKIDIKQKNQLLNNEQENENEKQDKQQILMNKETQLYENLLENSIYTIKIEEDEQEAEKERLQLRLFREIHLTQMVDTIECVRDLNKSPLIIDIEDKSATFFKYKGNLIDLAELKLREQLGQQTREESHEYIRKQIVVALKSGYNCILLIEGEIPNFQEFFQGAIYYQPEILFVPSKIKEPRFYKKYLVKEEEDVDWDGNKGNFQAHKDFCMNILIVNTNQEQSLESKIKQFQEKTGLTYDLVQVISINPVQLTKKQRQELEQKNKKQCLVKKFGNSENYVEYISDALQLD